MKAQFEICSEEELDLDGFEAGLIRLLTGLGGGSFQKAEGFKSNGTKYEFECGSEDPRHIMNAVGQLAAQHELLYNLQRLTVY